MGELAATGEWPAPTARGQDHWETIPGYEILAELGRGGMGVVYKARQPSCNRTVALKLIRDGALAGPQDRARFRIETEAVARVRHPNVVEIYETGEFQGRLFFAMEFVEGGSLATRLRGRPQPALDAARLVHTLALAVQHAHVQQIVHRDLKPANILLRTRSDAHAAQAHIDSHCDTDRWLATCVPVITDFGLAKQLGKESTAWTLDGIVLGTASYMAPEQASGRVREIGPAVDVYALGAILYELLTGRPPFQAATANETLDQVIYDEPTPPTRLNAEVPPDLATVCLKCLEKDPGGRYASAGSLADDLRVFLEGRQIAAVPPSRHERLARLAARDGCQLLEEIGRGPRSTLYRALYGSLQQVLAVKVFEAGLCTPSQWESRFRSGAGVQVNAAAGESLVATLAHPNLVPIHQVGCWDDAPFIAFEYVPHGSLAGRLAAARIGLREALRIVIQAAETMSYIHRQGVVHGNLKPTNVLFAADGNIRISDFRLSGGLFVGPLPAGDASLEGIGYLPPEALNEPAGAELRPLADVYGLGLILYELMTGRLAFSGTTSGETIDQIRRQDPVCPSVLNPDVTRQMETICMRSLRKNPWQRYRRAYDVSRGLRDCLEKL
jgi:serine/threonine protein kinase